MRKTALEKEWLKLKKQEQKFVQKRSIKKDSVFNQMLEEKVPDKLQGTLDLAFAKAFALIFEKGTGMIEKTYQRKHLEDDYKVRQYTVEVKKNVKSLRSFSKKAKGTGNKNLLLSGISGVGMGILGVGIPDIAVFTGMILKNIYEIALQYGFDYDSEEERYFILLIIQGAITYGDSFVEVNQEVNRFIERESLPMDYDEKRQITETANVLSKELLYMKFLQGIPVVGAVGGAYDAIYMKLISEYAVLKYQYRYLWKHKECDGVN